MTIAAEPADHPHSFDVCIIGAGPAGIAVALECERRGLSCLIIEAGGEKPNKTQQGSWEEIADRRWHDPLNLTTRQAFGGTSWVWGGHCLPLDEIDFEKRDHVAGSGWPIGRAELARWHAAAADFLQCRSDFDLGQARLGFVDGLDISRAETRSLKRNLARAYLQRIRRSNAIHLQLNQRAVAIELDAAGECVAAVLSAAGERRFRSRARLYVLAGGGLRTTQSLLDLQAVWPRRFGGESGPLGRYYMGHIGGEIATIVFHDPADAAEFRLRGDFTLRHLRVSDERQRQERLLNTTFMLRTAPLDDTRHGNGALSLLTLGLMLPRLKDCFRSARLRRTTLAGPRIQIGAHVANIVRHPFQTAFELGELLKAQAIRGAGAPIILSSRSGRYTLRYHAEQAPNPESCVRLNGRIDAQGSRQLAVNFHFLEDDMRSVLRSHEVLDSALRTSGKGYLEYWHSPEERYDAVLAQAADGYHQIGTTRMAGSPADGVVDVDCRVHGVRNLFVSSSSVFPTSGRANPTFPLVALSIRLAHHLAGLPR